MCGTRARVCVCACNVRIWAMKLHFSTIACARLCVCEWCLTSLRMHSLRTFDIVCVGIRECLYEQVNFSFYNE